MAASEAFLASTVREVQSIAAIEDTEYEEGPRTREAAAAFRAHVEGELGGRLAGIALARGGRNLVGDVPGHVPGSVCRKPECSTD